VNFVSRKTIVKKLLESKKFRDSYVSENIKRVIPFNLRTMRDEREWSQAQTGQALGKPQNVVSRLESPAYGKLTLQTLLEIAHGYDVGLLIKFVPFSRLVKEYEDVSFHALSAKSVSDKEEVAALEEWAEQDDEEIGDTITAATVVSIKDLDTIRTDNINGLFSSPESEVVGQLEFSFKSIHGVPELNTEGVRRASVTAAKQQRPVSLTMTEPRDRRTA
jgi:transcriptional regulator with XRE-family HTH domain